MWGFIQRRNCPDIKLSANAFSIHRVADVAREHGWHPPKSLDSDENFKPEHTLFCRELRFVAIYALFGDLWAKKCLFGSKTVFGQEVHYDMVYIAYFTEWNLQICDYAQKQRICHENQESSCWMNFFNEEWTLVMLILSQYYCCFFSSSNF